MDNYSFINNPDPAVIESLYQQYLSDPGSIDSSWQAFFAGFDLAQKNYPILAEGHHTTSDEFKVVNLINDYRRRGHLFTSTNPVRKRRTYLPTLDIGNYGLSSKNLDQFFYAGEKIGIGKAKLRDIVDFLHDTYC